MTENSAVGGPPRAAVSPIAELMQHAEVSMWAEGVDPLVAQRVLNRLLTGHPVATAAISAAAEPPPVWVGEYAGKLTSLAERSLPGLMRSHGEDPDDPDQLRRRLEQLAWYGMQALIVHHPGEG